MTMLVVSITLFFPFRFIFFLPLWLSSQDHLDIVVLAVVQDAVVGFDRANECFIIKHTNPNRPVALTGIVSLCGVLVNLVDTGWSAYWMSHLKNKI